MVAFPASVPSLPTRSERNFRGLIHCDTGQDLPLVFYTGNDVDVVVFSIRFLRVSLGSICHCHCHGVLDLIESMLIMAISA